MRILFAAVVCSLLIGSSFAFGQTAAAAGAASPPLEKVDPARPDSPQRGNSLGTPMEQAGRNALYQYLDDIAAKDEAARRAEIAKITTRAQAEDRQAEVRQKIVVLMGGGFAKTPLNAKVLGSTEMDGFRIEKVVYESQPQFYVTALVYVPEHPAQVGGGSPAQVGGGSPAQVGGGSPAQFGGGSPAQAELGRGTRVGGGAKMPAIVMAPGHASSGKAGDFAMASTFARNGFVVLSYDPIGQGERLEYPDPAKAAAMQRGDPYPGVSLATRATGEHGEAGLQPTLIGDAVARYFAWDGMRAVDYLQTRPEVDAERIGAFGCSGGGAMTALLGAADKRVKAIATACYITSMDALLPAIGPQDGEQSVPGWVAAGLDFADWVELAAPRPYAIVGTVGDMFPWAGLIESAREARRFYGLFDARALGSCQLQVAGCQEKQVPMPTGPTLNPDTANVIAADAPLQVIAGIGGHGNLKPLTSQIVGFFLVNLAGRKAEEFVAGPEPTSQSRDANPSQQADRGPRDVGHPATNSGGNPAQAELGRGTQVGGAPAGALQVTATGQVATSYPGSATVHSLNLVRAKEKIRPPMRAQTLLQVQTDVREVTESEAVPRTPDSLGPISKIATEVPLDASLTVDPDGSEIFGEHVTLHEKDGFDLPAILIGHEAKGATPKGMLLVERNVGITAPNGPPSHELLARMLRLAHQGYEVLAVTPRPSPAGDEEMKSPILGPFYLTELRAEIVGKTLLGMRVDDVIRAVDYLSYEVSIHPSGVDANNITVVASGHMGLVALHAAVLDKRITHVTVDHVLESYRSLLQAPMPVDAPQDVLPGVLLKYDVPDLVRVLGGRVTATDWVKETENLAVK
jgi:cephalosporin-C deacetylase-like acetyl esterase